MSIFDHKPEIFVSVTAVSVLIFYFGYKSYLFSSVNKITKDAEESKVFPNYVLSESTNSAQIVSSATPTATPTQAVKRNLKLGIVVDDYTNERNTIPDLESLIGTNFSTVSIYKQFFSPYNANIDINGLNYIKNSGKTLVIAWEPWDPGVDISAQADVLDRITSGSSDGYIRGFLSTISTYGSPVVIRFGHEMNGNWYPWGNKPDSYKNAYIHIYNISRDLGVKNVKWMWSINAESIPYEPIANVYKYYPGDNYVDLIGVDGFNFGSSGSNGWRTFDQIFSRAYSHIISTYNKPIVISELASSETGGDKSLWINDMFNQLNTNYRNVSEIVWFNLLKETDWRIESTDSSLQAFKTAQ